MASASKRKGDRAELEVEGILRDLLGVPARRALGAGRLDDIGDISGVPGTVLQVANWRDVALAVREKPLECELQRLRAWRIHPDVQHAATFIRLKSSSTRVTETDYPNWRVVQLVEQWATTWREGM